MKKMNLLALLALSGTMLIGVVGCGGGDNPNPPTPVEDTKYNVVISCPNGITASVDKTEAKKGETITLTITNVAEGFIITGVKVNGKTISGTGNVYTFEMPFGGAEVVISYRVEGDMTIRGETFSCALTDEDNDGIFKGSATVEAVGNDVGFDLYIGENKQDYYSSYDYTKSFGNISWPYGSTYGFAVSSGCTYDFFYDENAQVPFYVVRTGVNALPNSAKTLYNLFDGDAGPGRNQNTCNPLDLATMEYSIKDSSGDEFLDVTYSYKKYADMTTFGVATDNQNEDTYYTYKHIDMEKKVFSAVDTYSPNFGNNDKMRYEYSYGDEFSVNYDIVERDPLRDGKWFDEDKFSKSERITMRNFNYAPHMGNALEEEFAYAYRVESMDAVINAASFTDYKITSELLDGGNGNFKTVVKSTIENNRSASSSDVEEHNGKIYDIEFLFNKSGEILSMDYKYTYYSQDKWDFTSHTPKAKVGVTRRINYTATYGEPVNETCSFDPTPYFINEITKINWTNKQVEGGENVVGFGDYVCLTNTDGSKPSNLVEFSYKPATALDAWQYEVIGDTNNYLDFTYSKAVASKEGTTSVNVTNRTENSGVHYSVGITIQYLKSILSYYIVGTDHASQINIIEGDTVSVHIQGSAASGFNQSIVPVKYDAVARVSKQVTDPVTGKTTTVEEETDLITVLRHDEILTIKAKENCITDGKNLSVTLYLVSDLYVAGRSPSTITVFIKDNTYEKVDLENTIWQTCEGYFVDGSGNPLKDYIRAEFSANDAKDGYKTGRIISTYYNSSDVLAATDVYNFVYKVDSIGRIDARITSTELESYSVGSNVNWQFLLETQDGMLGVALLCEEGDEAYGIFGEWTATYYDDEYPTEYNCEFMEALDKIQ